MNQGFKNWLIGELQRGHRHESISEKLRCYECGDHFKRVQSVYERETRNNPNIVKREHAFKKSPEYERMADQLADRLKRDPMYREHLRKSYFGTEAERILEAKRANSGYYKKHSDYEKKHL